MQISAPCVVSLTWRLADAQGVAIDELADPIEFFYGGDDLLATVEEALEGEEAGFSTTVHLEPEQAFGEYDSELVFFESRAIFPDQIDAGMQFEGPPPGAKTEGLSADAIYTVTEVYPEHVVLDGNHALAGIALRLAVTVRDVRAATEDEIEAGSVTGSAFTVLPTAPPTSGRLH